jgi:SAM-dependent methyltransferase
MTVKALSFIDHLSNDSQIADLGCGTGGQTMVLAQHAPGSVTGIDLFPTFIDLFNRNAEQRNLQDRVRGVVGSMDALTFPEESLDLIWSEGAIYIMGFEAGLRAWKPLLKPGGYIAVTELTWLKPDPPAEVKEFWNEGFPAMKSLEENLEIIHACDYYLIDYFVLPNSSWTNDYYQPMKTRIGMLREQYQSDPKRLQQLDFELEETDIFNRYNEWYGYGFYIMQTK